MSFLAEVLSSAETNEIKEITQKVPNLKETVDNLKIKVKQNTENVYVKHITAPGRVNSDLLNKLLMLEEDIKKLLRNAENVTKNGANKNLTERIKILNKINVSVKILTDICKINEKISSCTALIHDKKFYKCRQIISDMQNIIMEILEDEDLLFIIHQHKFNITDIHRMLSKKIRQCFKEKVVVIKEDKSAKITITNDICPLDQGLLALFYDKSSVYILDNFANVLWKNFFVSIVDSIAEVKVDTNSTSSTINLNIIDCNKKSTYKEVFSQLILVLEFLETHFNFPLTHSESGLTTLEYIGWKIQDNLSDLIIKHCLVDTIPSKAEGLHTFKEIIEDTSKLESVLIKTKIFLPQTASLVHFVNNIDFHYFNKKCKEYLLESQQIMQKNLQDVVEVGERYDPENSMKVEFECFYQCSVSKSVIELIDYCESILQGLKAPNKFTPKLVMICKSILRSYAHLVPEYHCELLKTVAQQVALFHNNCFYISHNLSKWNVNYISKIPVKLNYPNLSFEQEISKLRLACSEIFNAYIKKEIKQINVIMKSVTKQAVQQLLKQQDTLKTAWHEILPYRIYNEALGIILNALCIKVIITIIGFKEISSKSAEQLVDIIKMIITQGPKLFTDSKKVNVYVKFWDKLNELNFVLGASLVDINNRWADSKGPLALQLKPAELKSLIKALFPHSEERATMLIKI